MHAQGLHLVQLLPPGSQPTCTVVTSVDLPCLMMSVQGITLEALTVNGEAMDASPAGRLQSKGQSGLLYAGTEPVLAAAVLLARRPVHEQGS